jgi:TRAP-type C4-dicarboxylate transport system permease small subunit
MKSQPTEPTILSLNLHRRESIMAAKIALYVYENFEKIICAFCMAVLVFCLGLQVLMRYAFQAALTWTEELSRFCFIWTIYLGTALAAKNEQHVRVTAQYFLLPQALRPYLWLVSDAVWVGFNIVFTVQGIKLVQHAFKFPEITPSLGWSAAYLYAVIPLGFILMTFRILQLYLRKVKTGSWREIAKIEGLEK